MDKRVLIAIAICIGIMAAWTKIFPPATDTAAPQPAPTQPASGGAPAAAAPVAGASATGTAPAAGAPAVPAAAAAKRPERQVTLASPDARFVFSSVGGTLVHAQLLGQKFLDRRGDPNSGHDVVRTLDVKDAPLRTAFPEASFAPPDDASWDVNQPAPDMVVFSTDTGDVHIEKRYRVDSTRFRLHLDVAVSNRGATPAKHRLAISVPGRQDPELRGGGIFSGPTSSIASVLCDVNGKVERQAIDDLAKEPFDKGGTVRWIAADEKFFVLAVVPYPEQPARDRTCKAKQLPGEAGGQVTLSFAERSIAPQQDTSYAFTLFVGPKFTGDLDQVRPGGVDVELETSVDVTFAWLSGPILDLLRFFHRFTHNWGLAIVLLTIFIKLVTFYPTQKSLLSAKKMQKLAPKMNAIRKKYENDRQRQSVETMNLYKAHGVSPFGGCLPSLIQMPIWIALYSTLNYAVELYRAPFFGHLKDLTAKDPYYITPLVMGGVMYLQMKMSPAGADPQQQAMMSIMMPIMFTAFSLFLPSGLAVYMLTSYLIGILQQLYVNHLDRKGAIA
jgi:YidC/Oxa1 family membrane protein insertase